MQKKLALLATGFMVLGAVALSGCKVAVLGQVEQTCSTTLPGTVDVTFQWAPATEGNGTQYLDLSLYETFPPGLFVGTGPLPSSQNTYSWPGLVLNKMHYWRVNTLIDGVWYTSSTGTFVTQACGTSPGSFSLVAQKRPDGIYVNDRRITDNPGDDAPAISPDGRTLAFERCTPTDQGGWGPPCNICFVNVDGSNLRCIADNGIDPRWFPSGSRIVFKSSASTPDGGWTLAPALYDLSSGIVTHIPGTASYYGAFGPSPDGRLLLLGLEADPYAFVINMNGLVVAEFHTGYFARGWSQDGRVLMTEGIWGDWGWGNVTDGSMAPGSGCRCGGQEGELMVYVGNYQSQYPWGTTLCELLGS